MLRRGLQTRGRGGLGFFSFFSDSCSDVFLFIPAEGREGGREARRQTFKGGAGISYGSSGSTFFLPSVPLISRPYQDETLFHSCQFINSYSLRSNAKPPEPGPPGRASI